MESKRRGDSNARFTLELFNGKNYNEWSYSATLALDGTRRLGYIDETIHEFSQGDPKHSQWKAGNILVRN